MTLTPLEPKRNTPITCALYSAPPPMRATLWQRLIWRIKRTITHTLTLHNHTLSLHNTQHPELSTTLNLLQPTQLHIDTQELSPSYSTLSITLSQNTPTQRHTITLRTTLPTTSIQPNTTHLERSDSFLPYDDFIPITRHTIFFTQAHSSHQPLSHSFTPISQLSTLPPWDVSTHHVSDPSKTPTPTPPTPHQPTQPPITTAIPGVGLQNAQTHQTTATLGESTVLDILKTFGVDAVLHTPTGDIPGFKYTLKYSPILQILRIDYGDTSHTETFRERPESFGINPRDQTLQSIHITRAQDRIALLHPEHHTPILTPLPHPTLLPFQPILDALGPPQHTTSNKHHTTHYYHHLGLTFTTSPQRHNTPTHIHSYTLTQPNRKGSFSRHARDLIVDIHTGLRSRTDPQTSFLTLQSSTPLDVLAFFGDDCALHTRKRSTINPRDISLTPQHIRDLSVRSIDYTFNPSGEPKRKRHYDDIRPILFEFDSKTLTLQAFLLGPNQSTLPVQANSDGDIHPKHFSTLDDIQSTYPHIGPPKSTHTHGSFDLHTYDLFDIYTIHNTQTIRYIHIRPEDWHSYPVQEYL